MRVRILRRWYYASAREGDERSERKPSLQSHSASHCLHRWTTPSRNDGSNNSPVPDNESQTIHPIQQLIGSALSVYECKTPSRYFNSSPEIIRLAVMMYVRFPLSLRQVEDLLAERGINICHQTVWFCWNRFGPLFAAEIGKRRVHHHWCSCGSTGRPNRISLHDVRAIANGDRLRRRDLRRSADQ